MIGSSPSPPTTVLGQHAAEVWARSRERHLRRVEVLERAVLALMDGELNDELRELAESEAHSLASAVGTFGLRAGPRLARALEQSFSARYTLDRALAARLADQVLALRRELERPVMPEVLRGQVAEPHLLMLLSDGARDDQFVTEGLARGFEVLVHPLCEGAVAVAESAPDAIVVEVSDGQAESLVSLLEALSRRPSGPVLVVSPNDEMAVRLAIAGAGAIGPLLPGLPPAAILERAQAFLTARAQATASVLIVDLDPYAVQLASLVLEQAGHRIHSLGDPARFWETLEAVSPDLVVLGAALGQFSGVDLCRALRADPRWRELPIVFMAGPGEAALVRDAYRAGGDDVVRKPLQREELLSRVDNRLSRSGLLRRQSQREGLTGLPGRQKGEHDLDRFLRLARRHRHQVTLVLLRLDRFHELALQMGQAALDAATITFGQLLQQSFRTEDVVTQWGPNEFVVGLFDANAANAAVRVRELMTSLRAKQFVGLAGDAFACTCSAGIATFPEDAADTRELREAADAAFLMAGGKSRDEVLGLASDPNLQATGRADVVLVESDPAVGALLIHALESRQYVVRWLRHGQEAADALLGENPEIRARLILLEVNLPGLNGLTLLRALAAQNALRHTRVIVISSRTTEAETVQAFELGAFDYVAKPFSIAVLTERIRRAMTG